MHGYHRPKSRFPPNGTKAIRFVAATDGDLAHLRRLLMEKQGILKEEIWSYLEKECFFAPLRFVSREEARELIDKIVKQ